MFKVTIKQYVKPLCALILIAAVLNSGCISISNSNTAEDVPVVKAEPETQIYTTPDGLKFFGPYGHDEADGQYVPVYDTDGDGKIDAEDSAVGPNDAARWNNNIAKAIDANFGIPTTSKLHQDYPDIEEFRIRGWNSDNDDVCEKIEIIINDEIVDSTTTDVDGNGRININDVLTKLDWK